MRDLIDNLYMLGVLLAVTLVIGSCLVYLVKELFG